MKKKILYVTLLFSFLLTGCEKEVHIESKSSKTNNEKITNYSSSIIESNNNGNQITIIKENNISYKNGSINNIIINGENVSVNSNGKSSSDDKENNIDIILTGNLSKLSLNQLSSINTSFNVIQKCSTSNENYLMIDSAFIPYLSDDAKNGSIHLKNGTYKIQGKFNVEIYTSPLQEISTKGTGSLSLTCVDKNNFSLHKLGSGNVNINDLHHNSVIIHQSGTGNVSLKGTSLKVLNVSNSGVGTIDIDVTVSVAQLQNSGVGSVDAKQIDSLNVDNSGVGSVNIEKVIKVNKQKNSGIGSININ